MEHFMDCDNGRTFAQAKKTPIFNIAFAAVIAILSTVLSLRHYLYIC